MKTSILTYILLTAPVFYQLDYRQRFEAEVSVPGLVGFAVKKSFETRYRPHKEDLVNKKSLKTTFDSKELKKSF